MFFTRGSSIISEDSIKKALNQEKDTFQERQAFALTAPKKTDKKTSPRSPTIGMSPRRRLSQNPLKMYNVKDIRLKESLKQPGNSWNVLMKNKQARPLTASLYNKKIPPKEGEPKSKYMIELEKTMNDERKAMEKLGKVTSEKFGDQLNLYNRYYAEYLDEPVQKYLQQNDLKVEVKPIIGQSALSIEADRLLKKKTLTIPLKVPGILKKLSTGRNEEEPPVRLSSKKFVTIDSSKEKQGKLDLISLLTKKTGEWTDEKPETEEEDFDTKRKKLFGSVVMRVEENLKNLQKMSTFVENKTVMNKMEHLFFKYVKDGNKTEVQEMLNLDNNLVNVKDLVSILLRFLLINLREIKLLFIGLLKEDIRRL